MSADHYETLGVSRNADAAAIKAAHRRRIKETHPDAGGDADDMRAVQRAYETLGDKERRARYDATGDDAREPNSPEQAALSLLGSMFLQACESDAALSADPIAIVRASLKLGADGLRERRADFERKRVKLEKTATRIKHKGSGPNRLGDMLASRIADYGRQIAAIDREAEIAKLASEMLKEYECAPNPDARQFTTLRRDPWASPSFYQVFGVD